MDTTKEQALKAMERLDLDALSDCVRALSAQGCDMREIEELLQQGMQRVGDLFAKGEYFLADLIVSGMMFKSALSLLHGNEQPPPPTDPNSGKILIGVMAGDIHDIGKDIIVQILRTENFDTLDLGVDVPAEAFVQAAKNYMPDVIALSGVMGDSTLEMRRVVEVLTKAGIHPQTPIIVGGACVSEMVLSNIGAVHYAKGPVDAVKLCRKMIEDKKNHANKR